MSVHRIYVEKKQGFDTIAAELFADIKSTLGVAAEKMRLINRYDVEGISQADFDAARDIVFSEPQVDNAYSDLPDPGDAQVFAVEYLPGQFDQRADSCAQCLQLLTGGERPRVRTARIFYLYGADESALARIKTYVINPVEAREASLEKFDTLQTDYPLPAEVQTIDGFIAFGNAALQSTLATLGLAMDFDDILFLQSYFKSEEKRNPTLTEIRMIDTYWSDHCRHTTFLTEIEAADIADLRVQAAYDEYLAVKEELYPGKNRPTTLMDIATAGVKYLKKKGLVPNLDESEEINACSVNIDVDVDGEQKPYLLMFKNETHNHPTEIEPFGGAATCLGGAIRDPLAGRAYVYQAMRVTGAADPTVPFEETVKGKLPQKKIVTTAAAGYSSYGNQIGLATGQVSEIYHPGYVAKHLETGAVIAAAPKENVIREKPRPGDMVILLGGATGRDGCGGATGSSKAHNLESLDTCGAEVQKGNAPEERKIQRLFRNPDVTRLIRRCNDFGAGGVSVAVGELADGLEIDLDRVPKKYEGLDATELAISESQERMACVVDAEDADSFIELANAENLNATVVALVTAAPRLVMNWNGKRVVDLSRAFLNSNGARKRTSVIVPAQQISIVGDAHQGVPLSSNTKSTWLSHLSSLNVCSQKGLAERFDSTVGAGTLLMPFGGKHQATPTQAMAAKIPLLQGNTNTCSVMSWGFDPYTAEANPYLGGMISVIESVARNVAIGGSRQGMAFSFQEYFGRPRTGEGWGKPFAALLGALKAQLAYETAAIGGKDSMSGSFENIDVPPTLISFAVSVSDARRVISPEFKKPGKNVYIILPDLDSDGFPVLGSAIAAADKVERYIKDGLVSSVWAIGAGGIAEGVAKMCFGNRIGFTFVDGGPDLFAPRFGGFILEPSGGVSLDKQILGRTTAVPAIETGGFSINLDELYDAYTATLEPVYPTNVIVGDAHPGVPHSSVPTSEMTFTPKKCAVQIAKPGVMIPVFAGTNCEYDTARQFEMAGVKAETVVINNLTAGQIEEAVKRTEAVIRQSQIIAIPGGFSAADEPEGSAKFIVSFFRNPRIAEATRDLLQNRGGLMLGICNGFQALVKLGLLPFGDIAETDATCPTLTFNTIARHQSMIISAKICSTLSPWLSAARPGEIYQVPVSHGEGRFVASDEMIASLLKSGQVAAQYVDPEGNPTMEMPFNPNGSFAAIEGITSPDGRILGKMGHSERIGDLLYKNVPGRYDMKLFESAYRYFT